MGAGPAQTSAIRHSRDIGFVPYAADANPHAQGFEWAKAFEVGDIRDANFVTECARRFDVDAIVAIATDVAVPSVAKACAVLGLSAIPVEAAEISVNKLLQRKSFEAAGLRVPRFSAFKGVDDAKRSVESIGLPVVVKPSDSAGSRGVRLVLNQDEIAQAAEEALAVSRSGMGIAEEYIDGVEVSVEGFVVDKEFHVICLSEKTRTPPPFLLDTEVHFPDTLSAAERNNVVAVAKAAVAACKLDNCPVHMEVLRSPNGPLVVELAARGAGFRVFTDILPHVTGLDTVDIQIRIALGEHPKILSPDILKGAVIVFVSPIPGRLKQVTGIESARMMPGVREAEIYVRPGDTLGTLRCGADRIGHLMIFGKDRQEADERARTAIASIQLVVAP